MRFRCGRRLDRELLEMQLPLGWDGNLSGEEGRNPAVGRPGEMERARETRIETIVPRRDLSAVINALKSPSVRGAGL